MKRNITVVLLVLLVLCMGLSAAAEPVVAKKNTRVYQAPTTAAKSIAVSIGTIMEKKAEMDGWVCVENKGITAYLPKSEVDDVVDFGGRTAYIAKASRMFQKYGNNQKHKTLPAGTPVTVYAIAGEWAYVGYAGYNGFVNVSVLTPDAPKQEDKVEAGKPPMGNSITAYVATAGAKVYASYSASAKVLDTLSVNNTVNVIGVSKGWACVEKNGAIAFMMLRDLAPERIASADIVNPGEDAGDKGGSVSTIVPEGADKDDGTAVPARGTAKAMDWWTSDIQNIFARGTTATITDVATGIAWKEVRKGGTNHADVQPCTAADTAAMKKACGEWSWDRRAIFVTINGVNYAASMNCMPHGSGSITNNNFDGHHCIHFTNSRGHSSNAVCDLHQAAIRKALNAKL